MTKYHSRDSVKEAVASDTILVIEDDQALSRLTQRNLHRLGFHTEAAVDGAQAIEWIANNPVKLLLVDYRLPDMTGDKVIKTMTQRGYSFPFIVVTGQGDEETAVEMMKLGARDYLVKDSTFIDRLPQAIERTLEQFAIEQKLAEAEEEVKRYSRRVQALYTVGQAVSRSLDMDKLLTQSLKATLDVVNTDVGGIYISDLQAGSLTLKAHSGLSQNCIGSIGLMNLNEEEIKLAMECHQPVLELEKVFTKTNLNTVTAAMKKEGLQAYVTVPLWSRGTSLGSLVIADHREHHFSPDELDLLSAIGTEIAVGIENALLLQRTKELSLTDELTGLYNRRHFYETLESELYRTLRNGRPFSLVMLDLDGFKEYNDRFGHSLGDSILQSFAQTLRSTLRKSDTSFRYGGDEFAIILAATDANRAKQVIDRIRAKWLKNPEAHHPTLETPLGFSAGIAQFPENAETADALVFLADSALYYAKREGGYRATLVSDLTAIKSDILSTATLDQVYALAATVDARDPYTYGHSARVADIAQTLAKAIGLPEKELADLYAASLLHDVGKVGIPDAVLTKLDELTAKEWETIKKHSAEGARIVGYVKGLAALVPVILHHHEWYDGTGYPAGLKGEEIPLAARIISLADAYDTMTTSRPYREVVSHEEACEELKRHSGTQFDPKLVEAFYQVMAQASGD